MTRRAVTHTHVSQKTSFYGILGIGLLVSITLCGYFLFYIIRDNFIFHTFCANFVLICTGLGFKWCEFRTLWVLYIGYLGTNGVKSDADLLQVIRLRGREGLNGIKTANPNRSYVLLCT